MILHLLLPGNYRPESSGFHLIMASAVAAAGHVRFRSQRTPEILKYANYFCKGSITSIRVERSMQRSLSIDALHSFEFRRFCNLYLSSS